MKNLVFQNFWFEIPSISIEIQGFSIEILGILVEILGFSFEILSISKIRDNGVPHKYDQLYNDSFK